MSGIVYLTQAINGYSERLNLERAKLQAFIDMNVPKNAINEQRSVCEYLSLGLVAKHTELDKQMSERFREYHFGVRGYDGM